ncbi:hypothetical protein COCCU_03700 [Corynebacterium occultum]|uniref:DUF2771 domain-containing protein n=1 Tax=Corynebacterium occultum TaxID=2675219 RepID=A0A6B8VUA6_9CORY|nr:DUF2771 domain-containing protein [Corynebacterium occultum]QGU06689.1 hypothetical protein COCCU_03700 [Corynebacterium occultum]
MVSPKKAKKKSLLRVLTLIIAVVIVVVASVLVQTWWNNRPGPEPAEISLTARVGEQEIELLPYLACEPGTECEEGDIPALEVGPGETLELEIPEEVHRGEWSLLSIYDDPAANDQILHAGYDADSAEIPGSVDPVEEGNAERPRLVVVEVSAVMIGTDADGEETPLSVVWSLNTQGEAVEN